MAITCGCRIVYRPKNLLRPFEPIRNIPEDIIYCNSHSGAPRDIQASDAAERRRYALLQAAATIVSVNEVSDSTALEYAYSLLAEIERREAVEREK